MGQRHASGAPEFARFATVAPSTLVAGTAYAIADGHYTGDNAPYAFVTHDYGSHWTKIVAGLPADQWVRAIRPDIKNRNIVYLGTEEGMWISFDGAAGWQSLKTACPRSPFTTFGYSRNTTTSSSRHTGVTSLSWTI